MPGMTGLEMLPKVKAERPNVPVIMITAYGDADTKRKAMERGASGIADQADRLLLLRRKSIYGGAGRLVPFRHCRLDRRCPWGGRCPNFPQLGARRFVSIETDGIQAPLGSL